MILSLHNLLELTSLDRAAQTKLVIIKHSVNLLRIKVKFFVVKF